MVSGLQMVNHLIWDICLGTDQYLHGRSSLFAGNALVVRVTAYYNGNLFHVYYILNMLKGSKLFPVKL